MKALKFLIPLVVFAALVAFCFKGLHLDPREVPSPLIGKAAPEFALTQLDKPAQTIRRADMLGKVWMLNVWASWCEACRDEHPYLVEFAKLKALPIYGLDYKDQREPPRRGWPSAATRTTPRCSTTRVAWASTSASTACPRPSSSTSRA